MKNFHFRILSTLFILTSCVNSEPLSSSSKSNFNDEILSRLHVEQDNRHDGEIALVAQVNSQEKEESYNNSPLTFLEIVQKTESNFPLILAAMETVKMAQAETLAAEGGFDLNLKSKIGVNRPGFYENEIASLKLEQVLPEFGAKIFGGYKIGRGDFPVWDGDLKSQTEGEYSIGLSLPLLAGRSIDKRRVELWKSRISQAEAQPFILAKRLEVSRKAAASYWKWVASGKKLEIAKQLFELAKQRQKAITLEVKEGQKPEISLIENKQIMAERQSILIRSERLLQQSAIALSLYWRASNGEPQIPDSRRLPKTLPTPTNPKNILRSHDSKLALRHRPELKLYELKIEKLKIDAQYATNKLLPKLYLSGELSKDVGSPVSSSRSKDELEASLFLHLEVPLQRRKAKGKGKMISAKITQLEYKKELTKDKILTELADSASALKQSWLHLAQITENLQLAQQIEKVERLKLNEGQSDLLRVNLREQKTATIAIKRISVITEYFLALVSYRANLGLNYNDPKLL